ncbi:Craniofacial development protein 2, partial [Camponotus floridanus]
VKLLLGDFNSKIRNQLTHLRSTGGHNLHENSNKNGQRLVDFANSRDLIVSSICYPHKRIHKRIWASPDGRTHNQIDHVQNRVQSWASSILNIRLYRGANCDSDHYLI